jgi:hypothetical protein
MTQSLRQQIRKGLVERYRKCDVREHYRRP